MFVSGGQFYVLVACVAFGGGCGVLFSISALFKVKVNNFFLRIIPDLIAFIITAFLYVAYSKSLQFPNFRAYMALGVLLGLGIYFKSFHILLAKYAKNLYNRSARFFTKLKKTRNEGKDGRIKS